MATLTTLTSSILPHLVVPSPTTNHRSNQRQNVPIQHEDNDATTNISFGVFAIVLALLGIFLAWLQIRTYRRHRAVDEEGINLDQQFLHIIETWYVASYVGLLALGSR